MQRRDECTWPSGVRLLRLAVGAGLVATLLACGSTESSPTADEASEGQSSAAPSASAAQAPPPRPAGVEEILEEVRRSEAEAVLVNVWATWCIPCREEFPDLMRLHRKYEDEGFDLVLVSADFDVGSDELVAFLSEHGVDFPSFHKNEGDMKFIEGLDPRWSGALPASFLYDGQGRLQKFWEGKVSYQDLEGPILELIDRKEDA